MGRHRLQEIAVCVHEIEVNLSLWDNKQVNFNFVIYYEYFLNKLDF